MTHEIDGRRMIVLAIGSSGHDPEWVVIMQLKAAIPRPGAPILVAAGLLLLAGRVNAAAPDNSAAGGASTYASACAGCHGAAASGGAEAPPLTGADFWSQWQGQPLRKLYTRIISTMPQNDPGTLTEQQALGIVAYLIQLNTGAAPNPPYATANALNSVIVPAAKPKSNR